MKEPKINVLMISPNFNHSCGVSKHVYDLLLNLREKDNISVFFITNGGDAIQKVEVSNIYFQIINFNVDKTNLLTFLKNLFFLKNFCQQNNINIIHTHHRYPELLSVILSKFVNIKTVTTAHSFVKGKRPISFKSDKIIAVSYAIRKHLINDFRVRENKIKVIYNNLRKEKISTTESFVRGKYNIQNDDFVFLFVGRINKIKGVDILVKAFNILNKEFEKIKLIMVGQILDDTVSQLKLSNNIQILEPRQNISELYLASDAVVLPSREDPFPYVMLEAGVYKLPLIASNVGGVKEFVVNEKNGLLFESENVDELYHKMKFFVENKLVIKKYGKALYNSVKPLLSIDNYINSLLEIYHSLLND